MVASCCYNLINWNFIGKRTATQRNVHMEVKKFFLDIQILLQSKRKNFLVRRHKNVHSLFVSKDF